MQQVTPKTQAPQTEELSVRLTGRAAKNKPDSNRNFDSAGQPHTPEQDLKHFGTWVGESIWVPPKNCSEDLAKSMLDRFGPFASKSKCWQATSDEFRSKFTQVREIELPQASIRLPKGRLFVTVTQRENFKDIQDPIPQCVKTRLDEFLAGPGKQRGVKVFYLKPLCIEIGSQLIFTTRDELEQAISNIQADVFANYREHYCSHRARNFLVRIADTSLAIPKALLKLFIQRKKREIDAFHAKLEFERRKRALKAVRHWKKYNQNACSFEDVLALTTPPERDEVINHYVQDKPFANFDRQMFLIASAATLPWFVAMSLATYQMAAIALTTTASIAVCDPAFVAEMPGAIGKLLKIGHFDEVDGVMHVEI